MRLLFIYNANSGALNSLFDAAHKIVSPSTYSCQLCKLTHGHFGERKNWKKFVESSGHELVFYHKDEFESKYPDKFEYPVILRHSDRLEMFLGKNEIEAINTEEELIEAIEDKTSI